MTTTETTYPNREHENADKAARRRALKALDNIAAEVDTLRRRIASDQRVDGDDTQAITGLAAALINHLAIMGALREVREWHEADQASATR